jgi:hypothetical protein
MGHVEILGAKCGVICNGRAHAVLDGSSAFVTAPKRRASDLKRLLHHDEAGALQMTHNALSGDGGHVFVGAVDSPTAIESERKRDGVGEIVRVGRSELVVGGHSRC